MLVGRHPERARLEALIDEARGGRSATLVVRGEAGIGKTALLDHAVSYAEGATVLRTVGVESEAEVAFSGLHQLVQPVLGRLEELPTPQRDALAVALALEVGAAPDRLAVSIATLAILAAAADDALVLCVMDDAQWLDHASAEALTFAARRVEAEGLVMLFAAREPDSSVFAARGIPELRLAGLAPADARVLLAETVLDLGAAATLQLIETTRGNPLALLELGRVAAATGSPSVVDPRPVSAEIQSAFLQRTTGLSDDAREALLLVAAGEPDDPDALWSALERRSLSGASLAEAADAGLLTQDGPDFCHPLARSAIYQAARPAARRAAHAALAEATARSHRRAWHLAAAADAPDERVAVALEDAASIARGRGGVAAEARALERAARLTPDLRVAPRRLLRAAYAAEAAGWLDFAESLLAEVAETTPDSAIRVEAIARRSYLLFDRGDLDRALVVATDGAQAVTPREASFLIAASGHIHTLHHKLDIDAAHAAAERAWTLAGADAGSDLHLAHMLAWTSGLKGQTTEALKLARTSVERADPATVLATDFGTDFLYLEDYARAREVLSRVVERTRSLGALGVLSYAVDQLARCETRLGNLTHAYSLELEALELTEPLGNQVALAATLAWLAQIEAMTGRQESREHAERALAIAERRGDRWNVARACLALGSGFLISGRPAEAVGWLDRGVGMIRDGGVRHPNYFRADADLIEALIRDGRPGDAERHLESFEQAAAATQSPWGLAAAARCRAMLAPANDLDAAFGAALRLHEREPSPVELARTQLSYGEFLRRAGERRAARVQLSSALEAMERAGARPWAERAAIELRATGEHVRPRNPAATDQLTAQELQVALLVAEGLTNREVAARLFLSPKTIEYHLGRVFRKLDVASRGALIRKLVTQRED